MNTNCVTKARYKRLADIVLGAAGIVVTLPAWFACVIAVILSDGRPVFFRQIRIGYQEVPFQIVKFRTMRSPRPGESMFLTDDSRAFPAGRVMRFLSLDELPELLLVVSGVMSLVGPRPLLTEHLSLYTDEQHRRHCVKPGITGWAQIHGRQDLPFSARLEHDVWYAANWSLRLDAAIMCRTITMLLRNAGVKTGQEISLVDDIGLLNRLREGDDDSYDDDHAPPEKADQSR